MRQVFATSTDFPTCTSAGIIFLLILTCLLPCDTALAQDVGELTPDESVRLGLAHNARLRAAEAEADEAHAAYRQVRAGRLPSVQSQASYTRLSGNIPDAEFTIPGLDTSFTVLPIELNRYHAEVSVEQPLFTGFRRRNQIRAAAREADAAALMAQQEAADTAFEIRRAYWTLFQAIAVRDATTTALAQVDEHLRNVRNRLDAGAALTSDLLSAQTRRSEVRLEQVEADSDVRIAQLELNRLLGLPLDQAVTTVTDIEIETAPAETDALVARALESRPQLEALEEQVRSLEFRVDATRGSWLPELGIVARYVYARPNPYVFAEQNEFRGTFEAGSILRWNLWEGGRNAETIQARARLEGASARLTDAREQVAVEVTRRVLETRSSAEAVEVAEQHVRQAEETLRVILRQFEEGVVLSAQVLEGEEAFRVAHARRAQALANHAIARAALLNTFGEVW